MSPQLEAGPALPLPTSQFPQLLKTLGEFFVSRGVSAYAVGGVVRDALLARETRDIDLAVQGDTRVLAEELAVLLGGRSVVLDGERGIVRVVLPGGGGDEGVDISPMPNGIFEDLSKRDFTLDATAVPVHDVLSGGALTSVIDPHHGVADLEAGVIRMVARPALAGDPARLMRAPRLAAELGFIIAGETAEEVRRQAHLVATVAPERVREELLRLLAQPSVASSLRLLDDLGLLCRVIPELAEARGVTQPKEHYWDVFEHCIETAGQVERLLPPGDGEPRGFVAETAPRPHDLDEHFDRDAGDGHDRGTMLKLAGLLHDVGKPAAKTVEDSGRIRFLGHPQIGAQVSAQVLTRLRFSRRATELVSRMVEHHLRPSQMAQHGELPSARAVYRYFRDVGDAAIDTLYLNMADYLAARGPDLSRQEWTDHCRTIGHILQEGTGQKTPGRVPGLVDGHDIMDTFSLAPGPKVGALLEVVREAEAGGEIGSREEAMYLIQKQLGFGGGGA